MNILVDRKSNSGSHRAFIRAGQEIDKGHNVFIFPEGGISSSGKLLNFKNGAFRLAIDKQIPIVPITYLNNWKILQNGGFLKANGNPGISRVIVHAPISTIGMTDKDLVPLRTNVREIILNELNNYYNTKYS
jgi:1-acyl-sn-glycerol-3-phosphate acyltransferase